MTTYPALHDNIQQIQTTIAEACVRSDRKPDEVTLVAVSKNHPASAVTKAYELGIRHFGENRVEEAQQKIPQVTSILAQSNQPPPEWHMIGHVQSRKSKAVISLFNAIHSVDSVKLARRLSSLACQVDTTQPILLQFNVSGEASKYGFSAHNWRQSDAVKSALWHEIEQICEMPNLYLQGLMTMAPYLPNPEATRPYFAQLRQLRDALRADFDLTLSTLSMGMTNDYAIAIEEGATLIRIGTALFGEP